MCLLWAAMHVRRNRWRKAEQCLDVSRPDRSACKICPVLNWARGLCCSLPNQFVQSDPCICIFDPSTSLLNTHRNYTKASRDKNWTRIHTCIVRGGKKTFPSHFPWIPNKWKSACLSSCPPHCDKVFEVDLLHGCAFYKLPTLSLVVPVWRLNGCSRCKTITRWLKKGSGAVKRVICYLFKIRLQRNQWSSYPRAWVQL